MTGQDAVLDTAALKREAHVRATIVECKDAPAVVDDEDRTMCTVHNEPPLRLQLLKAPGEREFFVRCVHRDSSSTRSWGDVAPRSTVNIGISGAIAKGRPRLRDCMRRVTRDPTATFITFADTSLPILTARSPRIRALNHS